MRILVIGGTRFVGRHIVAAALERGPRRHAAAPQRDPSCSPTPSTCSPTATATSRCSPTASGTPRSTCRRTSRGRCATSPTRSTAAAAAISSSPRPRSTPDRPGRASTRPHRRCPRRRPRSQEITDDDLRPAQGRGGGRGARDLPRAGHGRAADVRHRSLRLHPAVLLLGRADGGRWRGARARGPGRPDPGGRRPRPRGVRGRAGRGRHPGHVPRGRARSPVYTFGEMLADIASVVGPSGTSITWVDQQWLLDQGESDATIPLWGGGDPWILGQRGQPGGGACSGPAHPLAAPERRRDRRAPAAPSPDGAGTRAGSPSARPSCWPPGTRLGPDAAAAGVRRGVDAVSTRPAGRRRGQCTGGPDRCAASRLGSGTGGG